MSERLGDAPIEKEHHDWMNALARAIDKIATAIVRAITKENGNAGS